MSRSSTRSSVPPAPGRRSSRSSRSSRFNLTTLLAVLFPLTCVLALLLVSPSVPVDSEHPPTRTTLTASTLVCPTALPGAPELAVTSTNDGAEGEVRIGHGDDAGSAEVSAGAVTSVSREKAVPVTGVDDLAPGLLAARFGGSEVAATSCLPPTPHQWFTGVGAGVGHTSVLELTNPDSGTALADVSVIDGSGQVDAPRLRGVSVPGGSTVRLDLAALVPQRGELALDVLTVRGRLGATVLDRFDPVGSESLTQDWLPGQIDPSTDSLLLGLAPGQGRRTLVVANGGEDEVRAQVRIVTRDSVFEPKDLPELRIAPHTVRRVTVSSVVGEALSDGAIGLSVTSSAPVTAMLRSRVDGDISHSVPGVMLDGPATALLPAGVVSGRDATGKNLTLAGATQAGTVSVVASSASGEELRTRTVEVAPGQGAIVQLPAAAELVTVTPERTAVVGSILVSSRNGAAVLPLVVPVTSGLVPDVRQGLS